MTSGILRDLVCLPDNAVDFSSNDYLGFSTLPEIKNISSGQLAAGSTGSRRITGNSLLAEQTEQIIANFHQAESALIFNTGYMANVGLFSCIAAKGDTIISDEYIHASIVDGIRLSYANRLKFKHNDVADLEKKLQVPQSGQIFVSVESIYSMDGDEAPLIAIVQLCKQYSALLIVDEAHATGIFGSKGEGLVAHYNLQADVFSCVYTLGKAIGLHGAAVTGSHVLRIFLINHARAFIFTTALPPHIYCQIQKAYQLLPLANRKHLLSLVQHFKNGISTIENVQFIASSSPVQGIIIGNNFKAKALAGHLLSKGFFVRAILAPTVPVGTERLRICLHTFNTAAQVDALLQEINNFMA